MEINYITIEDSNFNTNGWDAELFNLTLNEIIQLNIILIENEK
jgi:hypothetical protein